MTVEEILADLGVTVDPAKTAAIANWNSKLTTAQNDAQTRLQEAERKVAEAQALQNVINDNIKTAGLTENNLAAQEATIAALKEAVAARDAALKTLKDKGFSGIEIPDLPEITSKPAADPAKELTDLITKGFTQMGQTFNEVNRYQRVFGQPLPEDPSTLADRAAQARMTVRDYMEHTYKVSAKEKELAAAAEQKRLDEYAAKKLDEYKAAHPVTNGHPELGNGVPSNYPNIPKPRDAKSVREFSAMSPMQKIQDAKNRVTQEVKSRMNSA